jgi:hypothetical protein
MLARWSSVKGKGRRNGGLRLDVAVTKLFDPDTLPTWKEKSSFASANEKTTVDHPIQAAREVVAWRKRLFSEIGLGARLPAKHPLLE